MQFPIVKFPKSDLAAAVSPFSCSLRHLKRPNLTFGKLPLGKLSLGESLLGKRP